MFIRTISTWDGSYDSGDRKIRILPLKRRLWTFLFALPTIVLYCSLKLVSTFVSTESDFVSIRVIFAKKGLLQNIYKKMFNQVNFQFLIEKVSIHTSELTRVQI